MFLFTLDGFSLPVCLAMVVHRDLSLLLQRWPITGYHWRYNHVNVAWLAVSFVIV